VDDFAALNARSGAAAADAALQRLAIVFLSTARDADAVARVGADMFALLLPETEAPGALIVAERLCSEVAATDVGEEESAPLRVTVRVGAATFQPGVAESAALLEHAEEALRQAKQEAGSGPFFRAFERASPSSPSANG
jgi:diguanylate cyclase (GGDEF)-like protein